MIVENKSETILKSQTISDELTKIINNEVKQFVKDDPAEYIYLVCHIAANFLARIIYTIEGYGQLYGIPNLTNDKVIDWIKTIALEHIALSNEKK